MKFGPLPLGDAEGAILAHSVQAGSARVKKGTMLDRATVARLAEAGIGQVIAARLEPGDLHEDTAAARLAAALTGAGVTAREASTGRVNLHAAHGGVLCLSRAAVDAINGIDAAVTLATLAEHAVVQAGDMVATVKIIPFAVPETVLARAVAATTAPLAVAAFRDRPTLLIQTELPGLKASVLDKTRQVTTERLAALGLAPPMEHRCAHDRDALAAVLARHAPGQGLILICGASAITDRRDVLPAAVEQAGGAIEHLGMPVDPGNLLLAGRLGAAPVLGLPGCARSPKLNGFDWVLARLAADLAVTGRDIMGMGVGGLLAEIPSRPRPRAAPKPPDRATAPVAAVILAAGQSTRMGQANKLTEVVDGKPMVAHAVEAARGAGAEPVLLVTGHQADAVTRAAGAGVTPVHNPNFTDGLASSIRAGIAALPADTGAAVILLGDMPAVGGQTVRQLIGAWRGDPDCAIAVPVRDGRRGNPVLFDAGQFPSLGRLTGDVGAKALLADAAQGLVEVPAQGDVHLDLDTPDTLAAYRARRSG